MTVHFITAADDRARGRFLGPEALLKNAFNILPEFGDFPGEWQRHINLLEGSGALSPMVRWRVPEGLLDRLWADHDGRPPTGEEGAGQYLDLKKALNVWQRAVAFWGRKGFQTQALYPLDHPPEGCEVFIEYPDAAPWDETTYLPAKVRRQGHEKLLEDGARCVPLFRRWQALQLVELHLGGIRSFAGLDEGRLQKLESASFTPIKRMSFRPLAGFATHRSVLEALSWYETYLNHALMLADSQPPDAGRLADPTTPQQGSGGRFSIQGQALQNLRAEEKRIAAEAVGRHEISHDDVCKAIEWLGDNGIRQASEGRAHASREYARLMRLGIEMLQDCGLQLDAILERVNDGRGKVSELFPSWLEKQRRSLWATLVYRVVDDFTKWPDLGSREVMRPL